VRSVRRQQTSEANRELQIRLAFVEEGSIDVPTTGVAVPRFTERWLKLKKGALTEPWIDVGHETYWVNAVIKSIIVEIFEMALQPDMGCRQIADILNQRKVPTFTAHFNRRIRTVTGLWSAPTVRHLLRNKAVIGEYHPHKWVDGEWEDGELQPNRHVSAGEPQEDFFPCIVPPTLFWKVQNILGDRADRKGMGAGRKQNNPFAKVAKCGHCGSAVYFAPTTKTHGQYLVRGANREFGAHRCAHPLNFSLPILEGMVVAVIAYMAQQQDPAVLAADEDPELAAMLKRLAGMKEHARSLQEYQSGVQVSPVVLRKHHAEIKKLEAEITARKPATRLQDLIVLHQQIPTASGAEQIGMRTKLVGLIEDEIAVIKLYAEPVATVVRARAPVPGKRIAEIIWWPRDGLQAMFAGTWGTITAPTRQSLLVCSLSTRRPVR
jgi:hypothetical protein